MQTNICLTISEGAELRCRMTGSNEACVVIGEVAHELTFDYASFRDLAAQAARVVGDMETKADEEEAEREAEQAKRSAEDEAAEQAPEPER